MCKALNEMHNAYTLFHILQSIVRLFSHSNNSCIHSNSAIAVADFPTIAIHAHSVDQTKRIGKEVHFECTVIGNPLPTVSWQHNGRNLDYTSDKYFYNQTGLL